MLNFRQLFPLGKAYGEAFCNRIKETQALAENIKSGKHTLLIAPRRYGKSSLAEKAIQQANYPSIKINFHLSTSEEEVATLIVDSVVKLIGTAVGKVEKLIETIKLYLSDLEPSLIFGDTISLKLTPKRQVNAAVIIAESLLLLEKLLHDKKKRAVIFFDEFQEIVHISKLHNIEGAIRTAAQEMQHVSIIFSGSSRSLLLSMFENESRPLYKLCRKIKLERINIADYEKHIQKIASTTWGKPLSPEVFNLIMHLSSCHPYYVNYLCDSIWRNCKRLPELNDVNAAWQEVVSEEWSDALKEIADFPLTQRRILKYISTQVVENIQNHESSQFLTMPSSTIASAVAVLIENDYVERDKDKRYRVISPLLFSVLNGAED